MSKTSFPLRIQNDERERAKRLAEALGVSENRLYAELIHDGMLIREQMLYMGQLRAKLEAVPADPTLLLTEPGIGYRLAEAEDADEQA